MNTDQFLPLACLLRHSQHGWRRSQCQKQVHRLHLKQCLLSKLNNHHLFILKPSWSYGGLWWFTFSFTELRGLNCAFGLGSQLLQLHLQAISYFHALTIKKHLLEYKSFNNYGLQSCISCNIDSKRPYKTCISDILYIHVCIVCWPINLDHWTKVGLLLEKIPKSKETKKKEYI